MILLDELVQVLGLAQLDGQAAVSATIPLTAAVLAPLLSPRNTVARTGRIFSDQRCTVAWSTITPRLAIIFSRLRKLSALRGLSKEHPDVVIKVPVSWSKPVERPSTQEQYLASKGASDPGHPRHAHCAGQWAGKTMATRSRHDKAQDANALGRSKFGEMFRHDFPEISADTTHLARNTVLTYFNGERISKYHKILGMQEVLGADEGTKAQFFPGTDYGGRHELPNGDMATQEICRDHAANTASSAGNIHFVHSAGLRPAGAPGDFFDDVELQKVELIQRAANSNAASRVPLTPDAEENGVELYNVDRTRI